MSNFSVLQSQRRGSPMASIKMTWSRCYLLSFCLLLFCCSLLCCASYRQLTSLSWEGAPHDYHLPRTQATVMGKMLNQTLLSYAPNLENTPLLAHLTAEVQVTGPAYDLSLAAVLPVIASSLSDVKSILLDLLDHSASLSEVVFVAPSALHAELRKELRLLAMSPKLFSFDMSISSWPSDFGEDLAVVDAARLVATDRVLLLDLYGLKKLTRSTRVSLLDSISSPMPVGVNGFSLIDDRIVCMVPSENPQHATFLLPPFVVSPALIPRYGLISTADHGVWHSFGKHIMLSQSYRSGGIVLGTAEPDTRLCSEDRPWHPLRQHLDAKQDDIARDLHKAHNSIHHVTTSGGSFGIFAIVLPDWVNVQHFSPAICQLHHRGYQVFGFVTVPAHQDEATSSPIISLDCEIDVTMVSTSSTPDSHGAIFLEWILNLPDFPDVVITAVEDDLALIAMDSMLNRHARLKPVVVRIPQKELLYCDWMGSLTLREWRNWHMPHIDITIITNDRPKSLSRLLNSLSMAVFFGDSVNLRINIDQTADADTHKIVSNFAWEHGPTFVHRRVIHGGLLPAVVESWYPSSNDSYGLILEDDVELSPLFYAWIKMALLRYRYGEGENAVHGLFGISLYQPKNLELRPDGRHKFNARMTFTAASLPFPSTPYLSSVPCSWGAVYFPEHWREFHDYLSVRLSGTHPRLPVHEAVAPGLRSNNWTRSWKKYFIELVYLRGYIMLYPNFQGYLSLSTNHLEVGSHVKDMPPAVYARKKKLFQVPLMKLPEVVPGMPTRTRLLELPGEEMPPWDQLPILDLYGLLTTESMLVDRGSRRRAELLRCESDPEESFSIEDLLCLPVGAAP